jgi:hypothetical protein
VNASNADVQLEIYRIQQKIVEIIHKDVCSREGVFYYSPIPPINVDIEARYRAFNMLQGIRPFPLKLKSQK